MRRKQKWIAWILCLALVLSMAPALTVKNVQADSDFTNLNQEEITEAMGAGWNLGNQLEASIGGNPSETAWGNPTINKNLIDAVKKAGFQSIRIPVSYLNKIGNGPDYTIDSAWLARVKEVVDMCMDNGLYAIINMHGDGYYTVDQSWLLCADSDQETIKAKYKACWQQIATYFKDYDEHLIFESMNEEFDNTYGSDPDTTAYANINAYNQIFVDTVRQTGGNNDKRWLLLPGWNTNVNYTADDYGFVIPTDNYLSQDVPEGEKRIMISVHYYDPWDFCGQEDGKVTQWGSSAVKNTATWGDEQYMIGQFKKLNTKFVTQGYPVVIGEYGAIDKSTDDSANKKCRVEFYRKVVQYARQYGCIPVAWDNGANGQYGFGLFNRYDYTVTQPEIVAAINEAVSGVETTPTTGASTSPSVTPTAGASTAPSVTPTAGASTSPSVEPTAGASTAPSGSPSTGSSNNKSNAGGSTGQSQNIGLAKGAKCTVGKICYQVTKTATKQTTGTVSVIGLTKSGKKAKSLSVPAVVKAGGASYRVTAIGKNACKGAKASKIALGKNVQQIAAGAFGKCKKLGTLVVKGKLKKVNKKAFSGCKKTIKVKGASKKVRKSNCKKLKKSGYRKFR